MGRKTFKMPSVQRFLKKKILYSRKKEPVWVYLEKEMLADLNKKPYNNKVGRWLKFLKDLKFFYNCEHKRAKRKLLKDAGPRWYMEFSILQRKILDQLGTAIHLDLIEDLPTRVNKSLHGLGMIMKIPKAVLMKVMTDSAADPGVFMWLLYEAIYHVSPCVLLRKYSIDAMIVMSSLVFIDLKECIECFEKITKYNKKPRPVVPKKKKHFPVPDCRFGMYLQKNNVTCYSNYPAGPKPLPKPKPLGTKCRFRSNESYTKLRCSHNFLKKRRDRNRKETIDERICNYKFWEPPSSLHNTDPKQVAYLAKLKLLKKRAKNKFSKKSHCKNLQYQVAGVSYTGDVPNYILANNVTLDTGYTVINGGIVPVLGEPFTHVHGHWKVKKKTDANCTKDCNCLQRWEKKAFSFVNKTKCNCHHLYDFYNEGKCSEKYFFPPTRSGRFWLDNAKIYQLDPVEDMVKSCVKNAVRSKPVTPAVSKPSIAIATVSIKALLKSLLGELSETALLIPHLPQAHLLNNLLEWVRNRARGKLTPMQHRNNKLKSQRRWLQLNHIDFRANAYIIPFTLKELNNMTFKYRSRIDELLKILLQNFIMRNKKRQLEMSRLMWATTKYDAYPGDSFLDTFFTYMPARMQDSLIINPYRSEDTPKYVAKTCPLSV